MFLSGLARKGGLYSAQGHDSNSALVSAALFEIVFYDRHTKYKRDYFLFLNFLKSHYGVVIKKRYKKKSHARLRIHAVMIGFFTMTEASAVFMPNKEPQA